MNKKFFVLLLFVILSFIFPFSSESYDIVIAGGGTGGSSAAIQASRMGASVLIVEPSGMLGGQATAAGVSTMDDMSRIESGIYLEFIGRVKKYYDSLGKSISTCYWKEGTKAFEPSVGHNILSEMAASADILYHSKIVSVDNNENIRTATIRTPEGLRSVEYKILVDATEYGDILPLVNAKYRYGNSISTGEKKNRMIQDITWTAIIRKYPDGIPEHLRPKNPLPDYEKAKKNYEGYVTRNGFDFQRKYPIKMPVNFVSHNAYRAVPDSYTKINYDSRRKNWSKITKTGVNWGNDYPGSYMWHGMYGLPVDYLEDENLRAEINKEALIKTLHFIYYVQNELGESWSVDENEYNYLPEAAKDLPEEWQKIARHMPPIPYVRECRRVVGLYTLTSRALYENSMSYRGGNRNKEFYDSIAVGGYILDLHTADDDDDFEHELGEKQAAIHRDEPGGPFQIPMRALIPESVDNFIAAEKNISMSRLVSGASRLQPITMMTGQAAGALAAIAVNFGMQPREIPAVCVQKVLADSGVIMTLCKYSDVPEGSKYFPAVQIATMYKLFEPVRYPSLPAYRISNSGNKNLQEAIRKGRDKGRFGINRTVSQKEFEKASERAEEITGKKLLLPEYNNKLTRGEAADIIINAMILQK